MQHTKLTTQQPHQNKQQQQDRNNIENKQQLNILSQGKQTTHTHTLSHTQNN